MKRRFLAVFLAALLVLLCLPYVSCAEMGREHTVINGKKIYFASEYEMEQWRAPLEKLLANVAYTQYSDDAIGQIVGTMPQYPDMPSVIDGWACALFDLDCDGVPELLVDAGGGSAGNSEYMVYDIITGENTGALSGGQGGSLCTYYYAETQELKSLNTYSWRNGWSEKSFYTDFILPREDGGFSQKRYLEAHYAMKHEQEGESFVIVCDSMACSVWGERAEPEEYLYECEAFEENCIRIKETELKYISWNSAAGEEENASERGRMMARALLSSGQRFIVYGDQ